MSKQLLKISEQEALDFHRLQAPGKYQITATRQIENQRDLALAYSPGVATPVQKIAECPELVYEYTTKGNMVAVVSNGTAVLGLGDVGALASKPVMEGKSVLFKRLAGIDSVDICVDASNPCKFIECVRYLGPSFGGINLEDIRAPDSFRIERSLQSLMKIPVFHDDQHGTAITVAAGLINALHLTGRSIEKTKIVTAGAGSAALATLALLMDLGARRENIIVCDKFGVLSLDRIEEVGDEASLFCTSKQVNHLSQALVGADVAIGLAAGGVFSENMIAGMAERPIIFAMSNPVPEIMPDVVRAVRPDAIVATGRSDFPNQVNNVLGFPYIFRAALDVRANYINTEMKLACAQALAQLARLKVPCAVKEAYDCDLEFGADYVLPTPFDPRLISVVPPVIAAAAMDSQNVQKPILDFEAYSEILKARLSK